MSNANKEYDEDSDVDPWKTEINYSSVAQQAGESNHIKCDMFKNWIIEVNSDFSKITKEDLLNKLNLSNNDLFLNLNYTSTLEKVYGISNVCHIHGWAEKHEQLVVGHGRDRYEVSYKDLAKDVAFSVIEQIFN